MFDTYRNHVSEGVEVNIFLEGFERLNNCSTVYKVDDKGKIDLGGQLKLTAGFGENASISVMFEGEPKFRQEFSLARRILRIASEVPDFCATGGQLENIEFEIVNADGDVDMKIHNDDQECQFHMLTIKSGLSNADESIRYTFKHGRCTVPSIRVPEIEGSFCFEASYSQYTELCLIRKVQVIKMSNVKDVAQHLSPDKNTFPLKELSTLTHDNNLMISVLNSDGKKFDDICQLGQKINEYEDYLKKFNDQEDETQKELLMLQDNVQHYQLGNADLLFATTKEEMTTKIKNMENSAASVLCSLSAREKQQNHFLEDIIGVVALLGSVQSPELSRMLAEYLGEDQMLGVICRSLDTAISLEKYKQNGEIDYVHALNAAEAASLGKAISRRFHVMGFEDIRPYRGNLQNDSQRKLALPDPKLSNRTPEGFMGYAVNMIELNTHHLQARTASGHGLRETVLFSLFKKLHVYKTSESMMAAIECIENGAVSLDGGIIRENGTLSLGFGNPYIYFPCGNKMDIPPEATQMLNQIEKKKALLLKIEKGRKTVSKHLKKSREKFKKKELRYKKHIDTTMKSFAEALKQNPEIGTPMLDLGD
ncbi:hypothetical protein MtrunA17_Chr1g0146991 [Medicago truncatula]|uniref:Uncharacterized protein n=2 Tax=Medicago truncatula TaxID=3880 RepID=A0A396JHF2_MEDTR|nr:hypothetical protein MtrunA17_Chr1g0146991 [Medicago truncatula]